MARYLKDRRTGELYGWNYEMAKLDYMKEVDSDDEDFNATEPDPTYIDPETGLPIGGCPVVNERDAVVQEALEAAAAKGQDDLDEEEVEADEDDEVTAEVEDEDGEVETEDDAEDDEPEPEPEPAPAKRRRRT